MSKAESFGFEPSLDNITKIDKMPLVEVAAISTAISLKRIADVMAGTPKKMGLVDVLWEKLYELAQR